MGYSWSPLPTYMQATGTFATRTPTYNLHIYYIYTVCIVDLYYTHVDEA
jgi:hypothetical protein